MSASELSAAAVLLRAAKSVVVFTGAGVSAESGIPTYRGDDDGLWSRQKMERFANPAGYAKNLPEAYEWYRQRALSLADKEPNAAHLAIVELATLVPGLTVVTQNIDSLHQRAGSKQVVELHGNLREVRCSACGQRLPWAEAPVTPSCDVCRGMLRPDVVMFEEDLPMNELEAAQSAALGCDVMLSIGTSNQVWPARQLPNIALNNGSSLIVVNPDLTGQPIHKRATHIDRNAGEALVAIVTLVKR
ncbi:MAG: silent information regulator protein Sir2 [Gemmatimonadetes bacterium]|nr:silent information regulator protein Sir2 [Gemmatimonadota bacterium]